MQPVKSLIRSAIGRTLSRTGLMRAGLRRTGVIIAFHRVNDQTAGDSLTRGKDDYERFCRFFRSYFDVVPLSEMIDRLAEGRSLEGKLAITHDDGYLDNYENAAPILEKVGVTATFFVSSGFMGTDRVPSWDRHLPEPLGWMTWDQVRDLRDRGFTIGAHTCSHADMGRVNGEEAKTELTISRRDLERELGQSVDLFAYPFGGQENMNDANRELVRQLGYRCCLSCHGGVVPDGADPFHLQRVPVSPWYANPDQLAHALGLRRA